MKVIARQVSDAYARIAVTRQLRNFDVFDFALNGLRRARRPATIPGGGRGQRDLAALPGGGAQ